MSPSLDLLIETGVVAIIGFGITFGITRAAAKDKKVPFNILGACTRGVIVICAVIVFSFSSPGIQGIATVIGLFFLLVFFATSFLIIKAERLWLRWFLFVVFTFLSLSVTVIFSQVYTMLNAVGLETGLYKSEPWQTYVDATDAFQIQYPREAQFYDFTYRTISGVPNPSRRLDFRLEAAEGPNYFMDDIRMQIDHFSESSTAILGSGYTYKGFDDCYGCTPYQSSTYVTVEGVPVEVRFETDGKGRSNINAVLYGTDRVISFNVSNTALARDIFLRMLASLTFIQPFTFSESMPVKQRL